jgi:hypothetical protein
VNTGEADATPRGVDGLRITGIAIAAVVLTLFFMVLGFPYDRLAQRIAGQIERQTGTRVALGPVSLGLVHWAPGLEAESVRIVRPDGSRIDLDHLGVRPAFSLAWLRGTPAWATDVESAQGAASGVLTLGDAPGFDGGLYDVDLVLGEEGPTGSVVFEARDGILAHPELPLPMPFEKIDGEIDLGGEDWARIRSFAFESPLASGRVRGTIGRAPRFALAPLRLQVELTVSGAVQGSLNAQGVEIGKHGEIRADVTGTPMRPVVR